MSIEPWNQPNAQPVLTRREVLKGTAGALVLGLTWDSAAAVAGRIEPNLFIAVGRDDTVTLTVHRSEMGQHVLTSVAQILADEMEADWSKVRIEQAIGHPRYGDQNTDGSRSIRRNLDSLRRLGASVRSLMQNAAAKHWKISAKRCVATAGKVVDTQTKRSISYGALVGDAAKLQPPDPATVKLKDRSEWRLIGKAVPSLTVPKIVRGQGTYGIDVQLPGQLIAVIARPTEVFASVANHTLENRPAGVVKTLVIPGPKPPAGFNPLGGVAVVAKDTWAAIQGRRSLRVEWKSAGNRKQNSDALEQELREVVSRPGKVKRSRGDVDRALRSASRRHGATYYLPHLAHASMEPPAATARWSADGRSVEIWASIQAPQAARREVARFCKVPEDNVTVHPTWLGGGFGRKSKPDFVVEAAYIAREVKAPVKVLWTREDDIQHDYYHTVSAQRIDAGIDNRGRCVAWRHRSAFPTIGSTFTPGADEPSDGELGLGFVDTPFDVPNLRLEAGRSKASVRIGWLRSVANIQHAFAVQSFAAELAAKLGRDPKDVLKELIGKPRTLDPSAEGATYSNYGDPLKTYPIDTSRLHNVIDRVAKAAGWGRKLPKGRGLGIAAHRSFLSYVATVVEVEVDGAGGLKIPKVWAAIDAGTVVNRRHTEAQVEGGIVFGLSNALYGEITVKDGEVEQSNFGPWRQMRMHESPQEMAVEIIESDAPPGGVGEPGTPPAAPALANAIASATGKRFRRLPILGKRNTLDLSAKASG
ncbi:MAG: molybdopterin cofactor-binding domain-containing protein [Myxococcota bacterium]